MTVVDKCETCAADLGAHDIGDGASVFLIFLLGFTIIPLAWMAEKTLHPPLWAHGIWVLVMLGAIAVLLPGIKCYIILLEWRHRKH